MADTIQTHGGAAVGGDVQAGTFIGRDQIILINGYTADQLDAVLARLQAVLADPRACIEADTAQQRLSVTAPDTPPVTLSKDAANDLLPAAARRAELQAYLTALQVNPRYGRWATQFVPLAGTLTERHQPPGWGEIPPEFSELEIRGEGAQRQIRRVRLEDITDAMQRHEALVLLGEPGAGKTTTLYRLLLDAAREGLRDESRQTPVLLPLAEYRGYASPFAFLEAKWRQTPGTPDLAERLRQGRLLLLCDALNELPARDGQDYREQVDAWRRCAHAWPGNQWLFTCRSRDYSQPLGLPQVEIERLDDERVQDFLRRYLAADLAAQAWERLAGQPLLELVRNPYYLSMLAYLLIQGEAWPASRAALFNGFVHTLLGRERRRHHPDWPGETPLQQALIELAASLQPLGEGTRLPHPAALARLAQDTLPGESALRLGLAATLLDTELDPRGDEQVRFYHHQLQDYFAARALVQQFQAGNDLRARWRQPQSPRDMPDPGPLRDDEPLPPPPATGWEEPTLLAAGLAPDVTAFIAAVQSVNPVLAARCLIETGTVRDTEPVQPVQQALLQMMGDRHCHRRARLAAGEALGKLGDPRFQAVTVNGKRVLLPPLVKISGGRCKIGSRFWEVLWLRWRGFPAGAEWPRHRVNVAPFAMGQYPVTHAEFACFIDAGGYRDARWWTTEAAQRWRRGELKSAVVEDWMKTWRAIKADPAIPRRQGWGPQAIANWERYIDWDEATMRQAITKAFAERPKDKPMFWHDERFKNPSQPVVGVNWFEADAYCRWLQAQWHAAAEASLPSNQVVRLPTEVEWEAAARTLGRRCYPWGNRWHPEFANTVEGHVLRTSPVGSYPADTTPLGVHDLSGNVWEWTSSLYRPYPYRSDDGQSNPDALDRVVIRGGSFFQDKRSARCASRGGVLRVRWLNDSGFRLVLSLADSGF